MEVDLCCSPPMDVTKFRPSVDGGLPLFADFKLKYLESREVAVHKLVLAASMDPDQTVLTDQADLELTKVADVSEAEYVEGVNALLDYLYLSPRLEVLSGGSVAGLVVAGSLAEQLHLSAFKAVVDATLVSVVSADSEAALALLTRENAGAEVEVAASKRLAESLKDVAVSELAKLSVDRLAQTLRQVADASLVFTTVAGVIDCKIPSSKVNIAISSLVPSGKPWGEKPEAGWAVALTLDERRQYPLSSISSLSSLSGEGGVSVQAEVKLGLDQAELLVGPGRWRFDSLRLGTNETSNSLGRVVLALSVESGGESSADETPSDLSCLELGELIRWEALSTELLRQAGHQPLWRNFTHRIVDVLATAKSSEPQLLQSPEKAKPVEAAPVEREPEVPGQQAPQVPAAPQPLQVAESQQQQPPPPQKQPESEEVVKPTRIPTKAVVLEYGSGGFRDQHGLLFFLGTEGGRRLYRNPSGEYVRVFGSSSGYGLMETLTGRVRTAFRTKNEADSCIGVELLRDAEVRGYVLRSAEDPGRRPVSWEAEVSADGVHWEVVDVRRGDQTLVMAGEGFFETQLVRAKQRWFRIRQTDKNSSGGFNLVLANLELYGRVEINPF